MRKLPRVLTYVIGAQVLCLALGLWLHNQFVLAAARWNDQQRNAQLTADNANNPAVAAETPTAMLTAEAIIESLPAASLITFVWVAALQIVVAYLALTRTEVEHSRKQVQADRESLQRLSDLSRTRDAVVFGLAKLADSRDPDTGHHLERISLYSTRLATALRRYPRYRHIVTPAFVRHIGISAALHDIGKVGVPDAILLKPNRLSPPERRRIEEHTGIGGRCLEEIERRLGGSNFLAMAREIAFYHHERWNGTGYPHGLGGEQIPLAARIVSIADVYDALASKRCYKPAISHEKCVEYIRENAGTQFDPALVEVFMQIEAEFREISDRFRDGDEAIDAAAAEQQGRTDKRLTAEQERVLLSVLQMDKKNAGNVPAVERVG